MNDTTSSEACVTWKNMRRVTKTRSTATQVAPAVLGTQVQEGEATGLFFRPPPW